MEKEHCAIDPAVCPNKQYTVQPTVQPNNILLSRMKTTRVRACFSKCCCVKDRLGWVAGLYSGFSTTPWKTIGIREWYQVLLPVRSGRIQDFGKGGGVRVTSVLKCSAFAHTRVTFFPFFLKFWGPSLDPPL